MYTNKLKNFRPCRLIFNKENIEYSKKKFYF